MEVKKLAIVGLGSIGRRHLKLIKKIRPELDVILVRSGRGDLWPEEKLATKTVKTISEAISEGIEAAIISSPTGVHLPQAVELAEAGIHLLIEKPLSYSLEHISDLEKVVLNKKLVVLVGYVLRYDPCAVRFKELLESDFIGDLLSVKIECGSYLPDWRPDQDYRKTVSAIPELGGGVLLELSHELDYMNWFFGKPSDVQAKLRNSKTLELDVEDQANMIFTGENGIPISMHLDFCRRHTQRECVAQTTEGELAWNAVKKQVKWKPYNANEVVDEFDFERDYIYQQQLEHFFECVENEIELVVSLSNGIDVMQLVDAVHSANKIGRKITL